MCIAHPLGIPQVGFIRHHPDDVDGGTKQFRGELVGLRFLEPMAVVTAVLAQVGSTATKPFSFCKIVSLKQKMPELMRDREPCPPLTAARVREDRAAASNCISQQHAFETVEPVNTDLSYIEGAGDLDYRNGTREASNLLVQLCRQKLRS